MDAPGAVGASRPGRARPTRAALADAPRLRRTARRPLAARRRTARDVRPRTAPANGDTSRRRAWRRARHDSGARRAMVVEAFETTPSASSPRRYAAREAAADLGRADRKLEEARKSAREARSLARLAPR